MSQGYFYFSALVLVCLSGVAFKGAWLALQNNEPKIQRIFLVVAVILGVGGVVLAFLPQIMIAFS